MKYFTCHVCQTEVASVKAVRKLFVVQSHLVQNRCVDIMCRHTLFDRLIAKLVGCPILCTTLKATSGKPCRKGIWVVVSSGTSLRIRCAK